MTLVRSTPRQQILAGPNIPVRMRNLVGIATDMGVVQDAIDDIQDGAFAITTLTTTTINEAATGTGVTVNYQRKGVVSAGSATLAPSLAQSGSLIALAKADGLTVTLPACSTANIGVTYKFIVAVTCTSVGYVINTTGSDVFLGAIFSTIAAGTNSVLAASTANKTITLDATTKGGLIGGWIDITCVSGTQWSVTGVTLGTGTIVTPFSN